MSDEERLRAEKYQAMCRIDAVVALDHQRIRAEARVAQIEAEMKNLADALDEKTAENLQLRREIEELKKGRP